MAGDLARLRDFRTTLRDLLREDASEISQFRSSITVSVADRHVDVIPAGDDVAA
jgi:hypothetical protein